MRYNLTQHRRLKTYGPDGSFGKHRLHSTVSGHEYETPILTDTGIPEIAINITDGETLNLNNSTLNMILKPSTQYVVTVEKYDYYNSSTNSYRIQTESIPCKTNSNNILELSQPYENIYIEIIYNSTTSLTIKPYIMQFDKLVIKSIEQVNVSTEETSLRLKKDIALTKQYPPDLTKLESSNLITEVSMLVCNDFIYTYSPVLYSKDGITWQQTKNISYLSSITYGNGVYLAVEYQNSKYYLKYSLDGINWIDTNYSYSSGIEIKFGANRFVMMCCQYNSGYTADLYSSEDGLTWEKVSNLPTISYSYGKSFDYIGGYFRVGYCPGTGSSSSWYYYTSQDGLTWSSRSSATTTQYSDLVEYNGRVFAFDDYLYTTTNASSNSWTKTNLSIYAYKGKMTYFQGKYYCLHLPYSSGKMRISSSTDGVTWTTAYEFESSVGQCKIDCTNTTLICFLGESIYTSTDGTTWTLLHENAFTYNYSNSYYKFKDKFIIKCPNGPYWISTNNLNKINRCDIISASIDPSKLQYIDNQYITSGSTKFYSSDLKTWNEYTGDKALLNYKYINKKYFTIKPSSNDPDFSRLYCSSDGITWTESNIDPYNTKPFYCNGYYCIIDTGYSSSYKKLYVYTSTDGITWNTFKIDTEAYYYTYTNHVMFMIVKPGTSFVNSGNTYYYWYGYYSKGEGVTKSYSTYTSYSGASIYSPFVYKGKFYIKSSSSPAFKESSDAITWTDDSTTVYYDDCFINGTTLRTLSSKAYYATENISSTLCTIHGGSAKYFSNYSYKNGLIFARGNDSYFYTSANGKEWYRLNLSNSNYSSLPVAFINNHFIIWNGTIKSYKSSACNSISNILYYKGA